MISDKGVEEREEEAEEEKVEAIYRREGSDGSAQLKWRGLIGLTRMMRPGNTEKGKYGVVKLGLRRLEVPNLGVVLSLGPGLH
jgi:hypothetical protein